MSLRSILLAPCVIDVTNSARRPVPAPTLVSRQSDSVGGGGAVCVHCMYTWTMSLCFSYIPLQVAHCSSKQIERPTHIQGVSLEMLFLEKKIFKNRKS